MTTETPDPRPGDYFVSVVDGRRRALLAGPYPTHADALGAVPEVREIAKRLDPRAFYYAFGTARLPEGSGKVGRLNDLLNLVEWDASYGSR